MFFLEPSSVSPVNQTFNDAGLALAWEPIKGHAEAIVIEEISNYASKVSGRPSLCSTPFVFFILCSISSNPNIFIIF